MRFCQACGGQGFCQPGCAMSTPLMQYHQRTVWYLRVMRDTASTGRRAYWAAEVQAAEAQLNQAIPQKRAA